MSVVTFWSNGKEQTGKTLAIAAIATHMAIEHNYKILVISTGINDDTLDNCFWQPKKAKKNRGLFGPNTNLSMEEGIEGLTKIIRSNKISPESITNYTKIVFKDRLEVLQCFKGDKSRYEDIRQVYPDIINLANKYYDLIFIDLDKQLENDISQSILENSNIIIANLSQRLKSINDFIELRKTQQILNSNKTLLLIGRYDKFSKYTVKNISRYMNERNNVMTIPYNTLFFEACEEAGVPDLFLRLRRTSEDDRNGFFWAEVRRAAENIIYRLDTIVKM